jgi:SAM-dependent methyltransferase
MPTHDAELANAFDGQAAAFERAPVQTDPAALARLVAFAQLGPDAHVLDAGCGPGIVAEAFLAAGHRVRGVDLSAEMVRRARERCARFGDRGRFDRSSVLELDRRAEFDGAVSRFVLHHTVEPSAFLGAQRDRLRPGGVLIASDHSTDPDPAPASWHQEIERARDKTHVRNLTAGELADTFARLGLSDVQLVEDGLELDFDEWFDRGTPAAAKSEVRRRLVGGRARGFEPSQRVDGGITIRCVRVLIRGVRRG